MLSSSTVAIDRHRHSCMALVASTTDPPPTATSKSAFASRAALAACTTSSLGLCDEISVNDPAYRSASAISMRCNGPSSIAASERVEVTKTRLAPVTSASLFTASGAGVPNATRSNDCTLKIPLCITCNPYFKRLFGRRRGNTTNATRGRTGRSSSGVFIS